MVVEHLVIAKYNKDPSDREFLVMAPKACYKDVWHASEYNVNIVDTDGTPIRLHVNLIDSHLNIKYAAAMRFVVSYTGAITDGSADQDLYGFWRDHGTAMMSFSPVQTFENALAECRRWVDTESNGRLERFLWYLSSLDNWVKDGSPANILEPRGIWAERFRFIQQVETPIVDMRDFIMELDTPSNREFFQNQPGNPELHNEYCRLIEKALKRFE